MTILSTALKHLVANGVTGDALVTAIVEIEAAIAGAQVGEKPKSPAALKQQRYRERKKAGEVTPVTDCDQPEAPEVTIVTDEVTAPALPLPPNENNSNPPAPTHPEGTPTRTRGEPKPKPARKVRFSADWLPAPLPPNVAELVAQWPPGREQRELDDFRDYWIEQTTTRPGWDLTWHRRIRTIHDRVMRDHRNDRGPTNFRPVAGRDNRDGFQRDLDDRIAKARGSGPDGAQSTAEAPQRWTDGAPRDDRELPLAAGRLLR